MNSYLIPQWHIQQLASIRWPQRRPVDRNTRNGSEPPYFWNNLLSEKKKILPQIFSHCTFYTFWIDWYMRRKEITFFSFFNLCAPWNNIFCLPTKNICLIIHGFLGSLCCANWHVTLLNNQKNRGGVLFKFLVLLEIDSGLSWLEQMRAGVGRGGGG